MKIFLLVFLFCFYSTYGLRVSDRSLTIPQNPQSYSVPQDYMYPASFTFGGFVFIIAMNEGAGISTVIALSNDTFEFVQQVALDGICLNPQFCVDINFNETFFLLCTTFEGNPSAYQIKPVDSVFFRVLTSAVFTQKSFYWQIFESVPYIMVPSTNSIYYVKSYEPQYPYLSALMFANKINTWVVDLQDFNWTSFALVVSNLDEISIVACGDNGTVSILATISITGEYSIISGNYQSVGLLPSIGESTYGYTFTYNGGWIFDLWDFTNMDAKPAHLGSTTVMYDTYFAATSESSFFLVTISGNFNGYTVTEYQYGKYGLMPIDDWVESTGKPLAIYIDPEYLYIAQRTNITRYMFN